MLLLQNIAYMEQIYIPDEPNFKRKVTNYFWSELLDDNHIPIPQ